MKFINTEIVEDESGKKMNPEKLCSKTKKKILLQEEIQSRQICTLKYLTSFLSARSKKNYNIYIVFYL